MGAALQAAWGLALGLLPVVAAALYAELAHRARRIAGSGGGSAARARALAAAGGLGALGLLAHGVARPPIDLASAAADPRVLAFAALAGPVLAGLAPERRIAAVAGVSLGAVGALAGPRALGLNLALLLPGYAAVRWLSPARPRLAAALQGALLTGGLAGLVALRPEHGATALAAWGLYAFTGMRHLSFAADATKGPAPSFAGYLAFLFFYPTCQGAIEVWSEFRERNLSGASAFDTCGALRRIAVGSIFIAVALALDASMDRVLAAPGWLASWNEVLRLFLRSALAVTGWWATYEGGALLLGWRVRPNFRGILLAESPSAFWRAWRGTMTNWLIRHVYVPLGGSRRARARNVAVVFAVSAAWHCAGTMMLYGEATTLARLAPVVSWAAISGAGVALHGALRARRRAPRRTGMGGLAARSLKIAGTWAYGSFTVTLLDLSLGDPARFALFLRRISGLG